MKQAAVDPSTGKIDVSILTTGISGAVRKQRADRALVLLELIKMKGKVLVLKYNKLYEEFREKLIEKGEQVRSHISDSGFNPVFFNFHSETEPFDLCSSCGCSRNPCLLGDPEGPKFEAEG